jgi:hypothetical protein
MIAPYADLFYRRRPILEHRTRRRGVYRDFRMSNLPRAFALACLRHSLTTRMRRWREAQSPPEIDAKT